MLTVVVALLFVLLVAGSARGMQRPVERWHPPPPFGLMSRAVCGPVPSGFGRCDAFVLTTLRAGVGLEATPMVSSTPWGLGPVDLEDAMGSAQRRRP